MDYFHHLPPAYTFLLLDLGRHENENKRRTRKYHPLIIAPHNSFEIMARSILLLVLVPAVLLNCAVGGPVAVGLCYTACNAAAMTCYASFGLVFGTVSGGSSVGMCGASQGACMASCWTLALFAPTP